MNPLVPARYRVLASLVPVLLILAVYSGYRMFELKKDAGRLAADARARTLALPHVEQARDRIERVERYLRRADPDEFRRQEIRDFVEMAVDSAALAAEFAPKSEEALRLRGRALELQYNFDEALASYAEAETLHPAAPARLHLGILGTRMLARARLADLKLSLGPLDALIDRATEPLRRFQAPDPVFQLETDRRAATLATACVAYAMGDWGAVAPASRAAREWDATDWMPPYLEGLALLEKRSYAEALRPLEEAVRLAPALADPHAALGAALRKLGRRLDAVAALTAALQASEHFLEAYYLRGSILFEDGRFADARADFAACARLRPSLAEIQSRLGVASLEHWRRSGRSDAAALAQAAEALEAAAQSAPRDVPVRLLLAQALLARGDAARAEAAASEVLALVPDAVDALLFRAEARAAQGKAEAEADYAAAAEKAADPEQVRRARLERARLIGKRGYLDDAMKEIDALIAKDPNDLGLALEKARLFLGARRFDEALAAADTALATAPSHARLQALRAEVLAGKEDWPGARAAADRALGLDAELAEAYAVRGRALLKLGDKAGAAADFKRAAEKRPDLAPALAPLLQEAER
jgi:tetratricopeptide (TPR) repeat protein